MHVLAIDIGSTKVRLASVSLEGGEPSFQASPIDVATAGNDLSASVAHAALKVSELAKQFPNFHGVGLATAGFIDPTRTRITQFHDGDWTAVDITEPFNSRLGRMPRVVDDGMAAALSEWKAGAAQGCSNAVVLTVGTKIGAGVILNNRMLVIGGFSSPQIGGIVVPAQVARDPLVPFIGEEAAGDALLYFSRRRGYANVATLMSKVGVEEAATEDVSHVATFLAICVANAVNLFAPERVVLTGGVIGSSGATLLEMVQEKTACMTLQRPNGFSRSDIVLGKFGGMAAILGAALAVVEDPVGSILRTSKMQ